MSNVKTSSLTFSIITALILWFFIFSPAVPLKLNFWLQLTISSALLCAVSLISDKNLKREILPIDTNNSVVINILKQTLSGIIIAAALWGIFWIGNEISTTIFSFADNQINNIYAMKGSESKLLLSFLLLFLIGPAEEIFWRGYVQKNIQNKTSPNIGFILTALLYSIAHIWSGNFMLIMAALVAGVVWGGIYRLYPKSLPALIISHSIWDAAVFVWFPI